LELVTKPSLQLTTLLPTTPPLKTPNNLGICSDYSSD